MRFRKTNQIQEPQLVASGSDTVDFMRDVGWVVILCMAITIIARDWNLWIWTAPGVFYWLLFVIPVAPAVFLLVRKSFRTKRPVTQRYRVWLPVVMAVWFVFSVLLSRVIGISPNVPTQTPTYAVAIGMMGMAYVGYQFTSSPEAAVWLFDRLAWLAAGLSAVSLALLFVGRFYAMDGFWGTGSGPATVFGAANGGVQIFLIFGCCWFGVQLLGLRRHRLVPAIGLLLCAYEIVSLTKSTIFSLFGGFVAALLLLVFVPSPRQPRVIRRGLYTLAGASVLLYVLNRVLSGRLATYAADRYLHQSRIDPDASLTVELINASSTGRTDVIWPLVWQRFTESPWVGTGFGQNFTWSPTESVPAHNGFLELLVSVGSVGIVPVVIGHVWWLKVILPSLRVWRVALIQVALVSYIVAEMVSLFGGVMYYWSPMLMYALALGVSTRLGLSSVRVAVAHAQPARPRRARRRNQQRLAGTGAQSLTSH